MQAYKKEFIEFMIECGVLTFGDFVTKSGRKTPFFVNGERYFEITLQLAGLYATKFNRITVYSKQNISTNY